ncbi:hypothetical protein EJC51_47475 [Streptomyces aquilus]|uniref:Uncharacterized protein n=1 Tax=Streptomyces aquilus TaxID=2548456 RepID=A0A3Q9C433_9ACTN|nr:hypothetical protein [Streptomyces aquilus]AZP14711.1 hypothetical protein EJC51_00070 [Streptomyces aquilus]AZP22993.1 hypothetical protein EJC51_47475 [Streptomyces aquilus]
MTDPEYAPIPTTPAAVASAVLAAIEARPDAFAMNHWAHLPHTTRLAPTQAPACGPTLCAAGWAAHVTGWTLVSLPDDEQAEIIGDGDGDTYTTRTSIYAERGEERRLIRDVAAEALGLTPSETFWYDTPPTALHLLREIAGR